MERSPATGKIRVCFVVAGLPHYFTLLLNKMVSDLGLEVIAIRPNKTSDALGSGVKEDTSSHLFQIVELPEYKTWYGKPFFKDLIPALKEINPHIVVMSAWPFFLQLILNPFFYPRFRKTAIKLICRDIPFNISYWGKSRSYYYSGQNLTEDLREQRKSVAGYLVFLFTTLLRRCYLPLADAHINYYEEGKEITASYGVPKEKIFVTANSPDTDELLEAYRVVQTEPAILPDNSFRLIHVGRLVKWKRVDMLIQCVKNLSSRFPEIELVVVGFGPEEAALKQLAEELNIAERIRFTGGVYDAITLGRYLHSSTVYVLGGMGGLSINDAMCFAKPVICSVADGTEKQLVREGINGYYFENGSQSSLDSAVERLLEDSDKLTEFGRASLEIIQKEVNINTVLREYNSVFQYVLGKD